ncbi:hypothetical protein BC829DRAFT_143943 [Chytridium lagenaria]|nr:hypothetical protein BC829DRAFT_143943 [Chytridium lagenaria]
MSADGSKGIKEVKEREASRETAWKEGRAKSPDLFDELIISPGSSPVDDIPLFSPDIAHSPDVISLKCYNNDDNTAWCPSPIKRKYGEEIDSLDDRNSATPSGRSKKKLKASPINIDLTSPKGFESSIDQSSRYNNDLDSLNRLHEVTTSVGRKPGNIQVPTP